MLLSFATSITFAQTDISLVPTPRGFVRCATDLNERDLKALYPERATEAEFERWLAPHIQKIKNDRASGRSINAVYNIPVVIHIIHNGDAVGVGENISDAQALSQIKVLNQDFRRIMATRGGANTTGLAVDTEINFVIAQTNPAGALTNGIDRLNRTPPNVAANGPAGSWQTKANVETMKTTTSWDPTNYFNIWVIRVGGKTLANGGISDLLGYAQFPSTSGLSDLAVNGGAANTDGLVCRFDAFGSKDYNDGTFALADGYDLGRTSTHELGHCFGLKHIWGDNSTCPPANSSTDKDYCADTPAASAANYGCTLTADTCDTTPGLDMVQNYMDYTDDVCMDTFTNDQKTRIQAVMAVSPRRNSLNSSIKGQTPTPLIRLVDKTGKVTEGTNCAFTDYNFPVELGKTPSQNATVTFTLTGTAANNEDYVIVNPTLTFTNASAPLSTQNLTIRVYNDGIAEAAETVVVNLALNANGGDAALNTGSTTFTFTIADNELVTGPITGIPFFTENADGPAPAAAVQNFDGDAYNWEISAASVSSWGVTGKFFQSRSWIGGTALSPDNLISFTTPITIPTTGIGSVLKFKSGSSYADAVPPPTFTGETYAVYLTPAVMTTQAEANAATPVFTRTDTGTTAILTVMSATNSARSIDITSFAGQTVYLSFRHYNSTDKERLIVDDIEFSNLIDTPIQTAVNTATQYVALIPGSGTVYSRDNVTTSKVIADITSTTNFNYGCTSVTVSRDQATAGAAAVNYGSNTANNLKVMARTVTVTPATANATGAGNVKFYLTDAEIAAWETATGNLRAALKVFKGGASASLPTTLATFGPNASLTATIADGISGVYYFGVDAALSLGKNELANAVSVYPNPAKGLLNISISGDYEGASYTIYNTVGQEINKVKVSSENDLKLNTSNYANGIYFIKIEKDGAFKTLKFVKN